MAISFFPKNYAALVHPVLHHQLATDIDGLMHPLAFFQVQTYPDKIKHCSAVQVLFLYLFTSVFPNSIPCQDFLKQKNKQDLFNICFHRQQ